MPPSPPPDAPHVVAAHVALADAFTALEAIRTARGLTVAEVTSNPADHFRLRNGYVGLVGLVRYAQALGCRVTLTVTPEATTVQD